MAYRLIDSAHGGDGATRWTIFTPGTVRTTGSPTNRSYYEFTTNSGHTITSQFAAVSSCLIGANVRITALIDSTLPWCSFKGDSNGTSHITLDRNALGAVVVKRGATVIATSANGVIQADVWHHWEARIVVHDTTGIVQVWIDGAPTPVIDFSGDTKNAGTNTTIDAITIARAGSGQHHVSDIRISDGTSPIGATTIWSSVPNGNGNTTQLDGSDGNQVDNYLLVDEATPDGDTTYVAGQVEGEFDLYELENLPAGDWTIHAVQVSLNAKLSEAGSRFIRPVLRTGGSNFTGTTVPVAVSYGTYREVFENNPDTSLPWTEAEVDALQVGLEVRDS